MIYLTIPVHNEERTIGVLLWKLRKVMAEFERDYRVLVLDDASTDRTPEVLARYEPFLPLEVLRSEERLGHGRALERLLRLAEDEAPYPKRDVAVTMQGDFSEDPADLVPLVKAVEGGADLVAGVLNGDGKGLPRGLRLCRRLAPLVVGPSLAEAPVSDPLSGLRAYRIVVLRKALRELREGERLVEGEGWRANVELLRRTAPHARRIEEAPYRLRTAHRERRSRFRVLGTLWGLLPLRGFEWRVTESEG